MSELVSARDDLHADDRAVVMLPALAAESFRMAVHARFGVAYRGSIGTFAAGVRLDPPIDQIEAIERIEAALGAERIEHGELDITLFALMARDAMSASAVDEILVRAERTIAEDRNEVYPPQGYPARTEPARSGPWDISDLPGPRQGWTDFGTLLVPCPTAPEFVEFRVDGDEPDRYVTVVVDFGEAGLRLDAYSAPFGPLWPEVRAELAAKGGEEVAGPCGTEVQFPSLGADHDSVTLARMLGHDGPGWLLRGAILTHSTPSPDVIHALEDVFRETVVAPPGIALLPRTALPIDVLRAAP
jgi:hypothetical protein